MPGPIKTSPPLDIPRNRWLSIIGIGEDGVAGLSSVARGLIERAEMVVGGLRHLGLAGGLIHGKRYPWPSPMQGAYADILARRGSPVVVLASGDPMHYGVGRELARLVAPEEFQCIPQPSAFSLAAARMGWALQDTACVTLCGRPIEGLVRYLQPGRRILVLSTDGSTPTKIAGLLLARGFSHSRLTVLENMGGAHESAQSLLALWPESIEAAPLNTVAIEVVASSESRVVTLAQGLEDSVFESDGQLTKREVRALTISSLAPRFGERLWDIGLGAGSVAIEWMLADPSLSAIGIEGNAARADRARRNALSLGTPGLEIVLGPAPQALVGLPPPDAVFIGGGLTDAGVFEAAWNALKPGGRLVANAVTIESESRLAALQLAHGGTLTRITLARMAPVGHMRGWHSAMPVTQWRVLKP